MRYASLDGLWYSDRSYEWEMALAHYWDFVKPELEPLERKLAGVNPAYIEALSPRRWYEFLLDEYFRWKYTAPNRYTTTSNYLKTYFVRDELLQLDRIRSDLFTFDRNNIRLGLKIASRIRGLGTAGASGLLSLLFPESFGTVDQFVVKALMEVRDLPERGMLEQMKPASLTIRHGVTTIEIMKAKAAENNRLFRTDCWTSRKIDMILWTFGRKTRPLCKKTRHSRRQ